MTSTDISDDDLFGDGALSDPYTYYGRIRDRDPVVWNDRYQTWLATDYDSVASVLRTPNVFSSQIFARDRKPPDPPIRPEDRSDYEYVQEFFGRTMSVMDPPDHTPVRRALNRPFTVRSLDRFRSAIEEEANELLGEAAAQGGSTEFVSTVSMPFPIRVISRMLGVPDRFRSEVRGFAAGFHAITRSEPDRMRVAAVGIRGFEELIGSLIASKRTEPEDDLLSHLAALVDNGDMTLQHAIANAALLLSAGHETTANLITNGLINLTARPQIWSEIGSADEPLIKDIVEECLRFDGPVISFVRIASEDTVLAGKSIRKGERVRWIISSANRDPQHFDRPNDFVLGRAGAGHLSFGAGIHFCLGANLARIEAQTFFRTMASRFPDARIITPNPTYQKSISFRAVERIEVELEPS